MFYMQLYITSFYLFLLVDFAIFDFSVNSVFITEYYKYALVIKFI